MEATLKKLLWDSGRLELVLENVTEAEVLEVIASLKALEKPAPARGGKKTAPAPAPAEAAPAAAPAPAAPAPAAAAPAAETPAKEKKLGINDVEEKPAPAAATPAPGNVVNLADKRDESFETKLSKCQRLGQVLTLLTENGTRNTVEELTAACEQLKPKSKVLERIDNMGDRVKRALAALG